jgi:hypothetical protein
MAAKHMTDPTETFVEDAGTPLKVAVGYLENRKRAETISRLIKIFR